MSPNAMRLLARQLRQAADALEAAADNSDELDSRLAPHDLIRDALISVRSRHACDKLGIKTWIELSQHTENDLVMQRRFGITSLNELKQALAERGLTFANPQEAT